MLVGKYLVIAAMAGLAALAVACGAGNITELPTVVPAERTIRLSGSGTALPLVRKLGEAYAAEYGGVKLEFDAGTNSSGAIRGVVAGTLDIAVVNRPLTAAEAAQSLRYRSFARDAQVFAVHMPNPVDGVTSIEVQEIYAGRLVSWNQLGGLAEPIVVLDRDEDESARKLVLLPLMNGVAVEARTVVLTRAADMVQALENTPNSIGYTSLGLLRVLGAQKVRVLALDGIVPGPESEAQDLYPWQLTFGLVYRNDAPLQVQRFVDFVKRPQGLRILEQFGYSRAER